MTIGFIGTGIMGSRMAQNLLNNGYDLIVHNRTEANAQAIIEAGATWAESPAAVAKQADTVITMLAHPNAVEAVALGNNGLLDALSEGSLWIDCSTVNPMFVRRMAAEATARGIHYMDAPVAGSKNQAQAAQLVFFVGGSADDVEQCRPLFEAMGKAINHVGDVSMGTSLKLVINHLLATSMLAFAEGMALGESLGIDRETLLNTIVGGPVAPPYLAGKRDNIASDNYETEFPLRWMQKDTAMVAETAYETGVAMPSANITKEIYQLAARYGFGEQDFSAIYAFLMHKSD